VKCIGTPISWPLLEAHAAGARDGAIASRDMRPASSAAEGQRGWIDEHVAACAACRACLDEIRGDVVALPALPEIYAPRRWWRLWIAPAAAAAAVAVAVLVIVRPSPEPERGDDVARVKGVGDVTLDVARARGDIVTIGARTFDARDRFKVVVTCAPDAGAWIDVAVIADGATAADYPLAPARVGCGNHVVVPGAFSLDGDKPHRVCARIAADAPPRRTVPRRGDDDVACVTIRPE
jgi:hypothetical protein